MFPDISIFLASGVVALVVGLITYALPIMGYITMNTARIMLALAWVVAVVGGSASLNDAPLMHRAITAAIIGVPLGIALIALERHAVRKVKEQKALAATTDATSTERPYLSPKLVVKSVTNEEIRFNLQIVNVGKLPANNIRASISNDKFMEMEREPLVTRMLPPGGQLAIPYHQGLVKPDIVGRLIVNIYYDSEINGINKEFLSKYSFLVRLEDLTPQTLDPDGWVEREGEVEKEQQAEDARVAAQFAKNQGTMFFVLNEVGEDGKPNVVGHGNRSRSFLFDPVSQMVTFKFEKMDGQWTSLEFPLFNLNDGKHVIAIVWDYPRSALLEVDGNQRKYIEDKIKPRSE